MVVSNYTFTCGNLPAVVFLEISFQLYSDEGDGYRDDRIDTLTLEQRQGGHIQIRWETKGVFPFPYRSVNVTIHGATAQSVLLDGTPIDLKGNQIQCPKFRTLDFEV